MIQLTVFAALVVCGHAWTYPSTYPFENEAVLPTVLPPSTPDFTFDHSTDPGGYVYYQVYNVQYSGDTPYTLSNGVEWPDFSLGYFSGHMNGFSQFVLTDTYGAPSVPPFSFWNCTSRGSGMWGASDYAGILDGETICNVGSCCSDWYGAYKWALDASPSHTYWSDRIANGLCETPTEEEYCIMVGGDFQVNCHEIYPTFSTRVNVMVCHDSRVRHYLSCPVYVAGAFVPDQLFETPLYFQGHTTEEAFTAIAVASEQDRVCHPYSYYHPSEGRASSSTETETSASSSDSATPSPAVFAPVVLSFLAAFAA